MILLILGICAIYFSIKGIWYTMKEYEQDKYKECDEAEEKLLRRILREDIFKENK